MQLKKTLSFVFAFLFISKIANKIANNLTNSISLIQTCYNKLISAEHIRDFVYKFGY